MLNAVEVKYNEDRTGILLVTLQDQFQESRVKKPLEWTAERIGGERKYRQQEKTTLKKNFSMKES